MEGHHAALDSLARVLIRCFILTAGVLLIWFVFYLLLGGWAHGIHARMFELTREQFDLVMYCGMGLTKMCALVFFLIPYIAIRLVLRGK